MISTTPLAEYVDMLYTRLALEMPNHKHVTHWWLQLRPPYIINGEHVDDDERGKVGFVELRAMSDSKRYVYSADMRAVQEGAEVGTEELEKVVEHHIARFVEAMA
jgi:hypothetical protein